MTIKSYEELLDKTFGRLKILSINHAVGKQPMCICECSCGNKKSINLYSILSSRTTSCGCVRKEVSKNNAKKMHPFGVEALTKKRSNLDYQKQTLINILYGQYIGSANKRKINFVLSIEEFKDIINSKNCYHCGTSTKNKLTRNKKTLEYLGIDRLDSSKGYEIGNVVPCCAICNRAKYTLNDQNFYSWARNLVKYQEIKNGY